MKEQCKIGNDLINRAGSGDSDEKTLEDQVKEICSFYYIASSWKLNHRNPVQLTGNFTRPNVRNLNHDTSGDGSGCSTIVGQVYPGPDRAESIPQESAVTAKSSKGKFDTNHDVMGILEDIAFEMKKNRELKRLKLDVFNRRLAFDEQEAEDNRKKRELERALMEAELRAINVRLEIE
ncbi:hypothetical protein BGZ80_000859 [Entomortierella chlamydospora]|uniref:Uncharacterized protein n=1 Tax=Entomortierella chlamydospora TaxID=101097 RepID=A0A9P6N2H6_9FUNG|nr:hypothetical protein BGZ80_000859 [Entomortierella chlamydospora]